MNSYTLARHLTVLGLLLGGIGWALWVIGFHHLFSTGTSGNSYKTLAIEVKLPSKVTELDEGQRPFVLLERRTSKRSKTPRSLIKRAPVLDLLLCGKKKELPESIGGDVDRLMSPKPWKLRSKSMPEGAGGSSRTSPTHSGYATTPSLGSSPSIDNGLSPRNVPGTFAINGIGGWKLSVERLGKQKIINIFNSIREPNHWVNKRTKSVPLPRSPQDFYKGMNAAANSPKRQILSSAPSNQLPPSTGKYITVEDLMATEQKPPPSFSKFLKKKDSNHQNEGLNSNFKVHRDDDEGFVLPTGSARSSFDFQIRPSHDLGTPPPMGSTTWTY